MQTALKIKILAKRPKKQLDTTIPEKHIVTYLN